MGYLYLVQPATLLDTQRYKIGMSSLNDRSRLNAYGKSTRVLITIECEDYRKVEQKLIKAFNAAYSCIAGNEYFQIDSSELEMINLFVSTIMDHKNDISEKLSVDKKVNWMQKYAFKK